MYPENHGTKIHFHDENTTEPPFWTLDLDLDTVTGVLTGLDYSESHPSPADFTLRRHNRKRLARVFDHDRFATGKRAAASGYGVLVQGEDDDRTRLQLVRRIPRVREPAPMRLSRFS
jgi:hypothetical protein